MIRRSTLTLTLIMYCPPQALNYDLTRSLLDLVVLYASIMILMGQVDDRRAIVGAYMLT